MKREVKIGIFAVAMIGVAWAGIRFLKGFDIFSRNVEYYAAYDQINGVQNASPIMMKGVKIGSVTRLSFDPARSDKVVLQFTIKRQYRIPTDSEAKIFSNGLMGAKAIEITYGTADTYLQKGDTLRSSRDRDLMDMAGSELDFFKQKVSQLTTDLSRTLENLNGLMETNADNIAGTLGNLNSVTGDMAEILSAEKNSLKSALDNLSKFSDMLGENAGRVDSIIGDVIVSPRSSPRSSSPANFRKPWSTSTTSWRVSRRAKARSASSSATPNCTIRSKRPATTSRRCWPMSNNTPAVTSTSRFSGATPKR